MLAEIQDAWGRHTHAEPLWNCVLDQLDPSRGAQGCKISMGGLTIKASASNTSCFDGAAGRDTVSGVTGVGQADGRDSVCSGDGDGRSSITGSSTIAGSNTEGGHVGSGATGGDVGGSVSTVHHMSEVPAAGENMGHAAGVALSSDSKDTGKKKSKWDTLGIKSKVSATTLRG